MQSHRDGVGEIRFPDNDGDRTAAHGVAEHDKPGERARIERHRGFAGHDEGAKRVVGKARHRIRLDRDDALLTRHGVAR